MGELVSRSPGVAGDAKVETWSEGDKTSVSVPSDQHQPDPIELDPKSSMDVVQTSESPQEGPKNIVVDVQAQEGNLSGTGPPEAVQKQQFSPKKSWGDAVAKAHRGKKRKPRSDKGRKRGTYKPRKPKPLGKDIEVNEFYARVYAYLTRAEAYEDGEKFVEGHIMLGVAEALKGPNAKEWQAAIEKERIRIEMFETWRPASDSEISGAKNVIPLALILSVKRDGTHKCRAVALGHLDRGKGEVQSYAPVASLASCRPQIIRAARDGHEVLPYDLDNAFLGAKLEREVYCSLPPIWKEKNSSGVVRLQRALYGLIDSPRLWFKRYRETLLSLGWEACPQQEGIYRKKSVCDPSTYMRKSVYVDDNVATGPDLAELRKELDSIFAAHPGRFIEMSQVAEPVSGIQCTYFDLLGADVYFSLNENFAKITMASYITKMAAKYDLSEGSFKPCHSPTFYETAILDEKAAKVESFPARQICGELQWIATCGRPDVTVPVSVLSKYTADVPNIPYTKACRKVIKYLVTHKHEGITYSREAELAFNETYSKLLPAGRKLPSFNVFSDASYANCLKTLRSTTGSILYMHGTPILWKSAKQGVRAYSTGEAEYIAASDTIIITEHNDWISFFEDVPDEIVKPNNGLAPDTDKILWVDNTSAITVAQSEDFKPKSRHYALRYLRVKDHAKDIVFCPTTLQKADGLTKLECSGSQRRMLLHNIIDPVIEYENEEFSDSEDEEMLPSSNDAAVCCAFLYSDLLC